MKKIIKNISAGFLIGAINGIFGAGGGMLAVPYLKKCGFNQKQAHSNVVAVILPITVMSGIMYMFNGYVSFGDSLKYLPSGVIGTVIATALLKRINADVLKKIFGGFSVYAGVRLLLR